MDSMSMLTRHRFVLLGNGDKGLGWPSAAPGEHRIRTFRTIKKLPINQWKIIATANLGDMLDFFDFFLIGYVLAFIVGPWNLTFDQSAMVLVSSGLGAVPGAFF